MDELLRDAAEMVALDGPPVILIGEYIPENFLLGGRDVRGGQLAGLFDFGDVMTGRRRVRPAGSERVNGRRPAAHGREGCLRDSDIQPRLRFRPETAADGADAAASG